jgi:hypothetical protein
MNTALATLRPKVGKLIRLLASDQDGEVVASARALHRTLRNAGLDFNDLGQMIEAPTRPYQRTADPNSDWHAMARACAEYVHELSDRERSFVRSMTKWRGEPSEKQLDWLIAIFERIREDAA